MDNDGSLQQVQSRRANDTFRNYANAFNYTAAGAVSAMRLGNGRRENTAFNSRLQPAQIGVGGSATNTSLLKLNYNYSSTQNNGNVLSQTITVPTVGANAGFAAVQTYTYDSLNRLKSATENIDGNQTPSWKQTYTFDRYGNRRFDAANTTTIPAGCAEAVCNPQIDPATNKLVGYQFDNAGNTKVDANGQTFTYDSENKQTVVSSQQSVVIGEYFYDGDGKRVKKVVPDGETTIFVYDAGGKSIAEYSTIVEPTATAKVSYLTNDHLGSPRINTDANGTITARHDYHPFGEEIGTSQRTASLGYLIDTIRKQFTGYERDGETGLSFAQARMYSAGHGRFTVGDPMAESGRLEMPQTLNRYTYVNNNPLNLIDPFGLMDECPPANPKCNEEKKRKGKKDAEGDGTSADDDEPIVINTVIDCGGDGDCRNDDNKGKENLTMITFVKRPGGLPDNHPCRESKSSFACYMAQLELIPILPAAPVIKGGTIAGKIVNKVVDKVFKFFGIRKAAPKTLPSAGLGTGRNVPANLTEQLAMEAARANPAAGLELKSVVMTGRWPATAGWVKMSQNINGVEIHYVYNKITGLVDDFKFK